MGFSQSERLTEGAELGVKKCRLARWLKAVIASAGKCCLKLAEHACRFPNNDAGSDAYIHGMLGSVLRNFEGAVALINHILTHALHLVAHDQGVTTRRVEAELTEFFAAFNLFDGQHNVAFGL